MATATEVCPANPFQDIPSSPGRRTLEYQHTLNVYLAEGKVIPMQLWEGMDLFVQVAALFDRCRHFERRCAELESANERLQETMTAMDERWKKGIPQRKG